MTYALGIDVGTTFTAAATWRDGRVETVPLGDRSNTVPSVVFVRDDGVVLVGDAANRRAVSEPTGIAREFKRRIGDEVPVVLAGRPFTPQALAGTMIDWVVRRVAEREGAPAAQVTLTCPANWGEFRRQLMVEAASAVGVTGVGLVTEPAAAATYYASQERIEPGSVVAVYDLGGGTFDATVLRKTEDGFELCGEPGGDDSLGGIDFDQAVVDHVAAALGTRWSSLDLRDPAVLRALAQVRVNAVEAKEALSADVEAGIAVILPDLTREVRLTRSELEGMVRAPLVRTLEILKRAVASAGIEPAQLHAVLLVGGSSRIPLVSELIASELRVPVAVDAHPKFAVCLGAAIAAGSRVQPAAAAPPPRQAEAWAAPHGAEATAPVQAATAAPPHAPTPAPTPAPAAAAAPEAATVVVGRAEGTDALLLGGHGAVAPDELMLAEPAAPATARGPARPAPPPGRGEPLPVVRAVPADTPAGPGPSVAPPSAGPGAPAGAGPSTGPLPVGTGTAPSELPVRGERQWTRWAAAATVAVLVAGVLVWWLGPAGAERPATPPVRTVASTTATQPKPAPVWTALGKAPLTFESAGTAVFGGRVWVAGGFDEDRKASTEVLVFDPAAGAWRHGPRLPQPLTHAALVSTGGTLLLIGGYEGESTTPMATVQQLDLAASRWVPGPSLPLPLGAGAAAWDGHRVVYAGGVAPGSQTSSAVLALENGSWRRLGSLPRAREHLAAASDGQGKVWFLAGEVTGRDNSKTAFAEVDLVEGGSVRRVGAVRTPRGSVAGFWAPSVGACAVGGRNGSGLLAKVECIDAQGRVSSLPPLLTARHGLSAAVVDGVVYALGGAVSDRLATEIAESLRLPS